MKKKIDGGAFYNNLFNTLVLNIIICGCIGLSVVDSYDLVGIVVYSTAIVGGVLTYWMNKRWGKYATPR